MSERNLTPEYDQILVPNNNTYKIFPMAQFMGTTGKNPFVASSGFGQAPFYYIKTSGPDQDGNTPIALRWDERIIQLTLRYSQYDRDLYWKARGDLLRILSPEQSFGASTIVPMQYQKNFPGGAIMRGNGAIVENGSQVVLIPYGRFIDQGGLQGKNKLTIDGVDYLTESVPNDFTAILTVPYAGSSSDNAQWRYIASQSRKTLNCFSSGGIDPIQDVSQQSFRPNEGFTAVVRFTANNPFWFGDEQRQTWELPDNFGDLVFDGAGAWFGSEPGNGRWLFDATSVSGSVNVVYWGTYRARPVLVVDGPAESISFQNQTTGKSIQVEYTIAQNESITIDTFSTTVTKNDGTDLLNFTSGDISFFAIEPEKADQGKLNQIFVSFSGANSFSRATMYYKNAYTGI